MFSTWPDSATRKRKGESIAALKREIERTMRSGLLNCNHDAANKGRQNNNAFTIIRPGKPRRGQNGYSGGAQHLNDLIASVFLTRQPQE